jgi:hypothetical protein
MVDFRTAIDVSFQQAKVRKHESDDSDKLSTAANPRKRKRQKDWPVWKRSLSKYLLTIPGQDDGVNGDIEQLSIASATLVGIEYKTDARKVQQLIGFVQEETAETKIKPKEKKQDRRNDIKALRAHYGEEVSDKIR